ncbi:MAG: cysteinyl-tRNA synthetase [Patescibacteria group bacterium]|jgi:cysteinyl-tRNA synthetase|nr:cysteinyl-tRNA synthetase [Patescibacteria group bacterium]
MEIRRTKARTNKKIHGASGVKLYNTLNRTVEDFKPLEDKKVKMYTCGLTVYSQPHIGNWVAYIYWDILVRTLKASGYEVERVQNITDVGHLTSDEDAGEDKMLKGALKEGLTAWEVAEKYIKIADREAFELLGLLHPEHMPRATEYIQQQIDFVKILEEKGFTYVIDDGVYFDTSKLENYGELARLDIEGLQFGVRVEDTGKKNPTDFAVWKFSKPEEKRDMEWDSPWGTGFPGWHLECSVMAREILGDSIDIHTGGIDHIPVHHTNEIAQTEAITGKKFSNFWVHANHIKVDGTKISKSLENGYTLQDILDKGYNLRAFKLLVLSKHYRTEGNFTWEILEAAQNRLNNWREMFNRRWQIDTISDNQPDITDSILESLQNDLNSPKALAQIDAYFDAVDQTSAMPNRDTLLAIRDLLGIDLLDDDITDEQKQLIKDRKDAREAKDWAKSDELRDKLKEQGIEVKDTPNGTIWSRT